MSIRGSAKEILIEQYGYGPVMKEGKLPKLRIFTKLPLYDKVCVQVRISMAVNPSNFVVSHPT